MDEQNVPAGHVRALIERPYNRILEAAARAVLEGEDPSGIMRDYVGVAEASGFIPDPTFGALPIGGGVESALPRNRQEAKAFFDPGKKDSRFLVHGFIPARGSEGVPEYIIEKDERYPVHSNPLIGGLWTLPPRPPTPPRPCLPTCGTSERVGDTTTVRTKLDTQALHASGLRGDGVAIAIVDSGIFKPRIETLLGDNLEPKTSFTLDDLRSWKPGGLVTQPGQHRVGHGTMCAYDALIAAPDAALLDVPMLVARPIADHRVTATVATAVLAYYHLVKVWLLGPPPPYDSLVVSNSWGIFHPCLEDYQPGHPFRFIDNNKHFFHALTEILSIAGMDIVFCGNNCGDGSNCAGNCPSGTCLSTTSRMIMGANAYRHVLTVGGCDTNDRWVGYSSRGPSIANMYTNPKDQQKPDLVGYTHFLGSRVSRVFVPDTGVSAACPVVAGCVAALRTRSVGTKVSSTKLFETLRDTAHRTPDMPAVGWDRRYGHGVIRPVDAGRALGIIP
jgi:hypothetical protein